MRTVYTYTYRFAISEKCASQNRVFVCHSYAKQSLFAAQTFLQYFLSLTRLRQTWASNPSTGRQQPASPSNSTLGATFSLTIQNLSTVVSAIVGVEVWLVVIVDVGVVEVDRIVVAASRVRGFNKILTPAACVGLMSVHKSSPKPTPKQKQKQIPKQKKQKKQKNKLSTLSRAHANCYKLMQTACSQVGPWHSPEMTPH